MSKETRNIFVSAVSAEGEDGFDIVLSWSGRGRYSLHHAHDGLLYEVLKDGRK